MTHITVFHATPEMFGRTSMFGLLSSLTARDLHNAFLEGSKYAKVAQVSTDDKNVAYASTQHAFEAWFENDNVECFNHESRSTSAGDIFLVSQSLPDGGELFECWAVSAMGFERLDR